eukprot:3624370-Pleurochrysis_carterae.AAC.1
MPRRRAHMDRIVHSVRRWVLVHVRRRYAPTTTRTRDAQTIAFQVTSLSTASFRYEEPRTQQEAASRSLLSIPLSPRLLTHESEFCATYICVHLAVPAGKHCSNHRRLHRDGPAGAAARAARQRLGGQPCPIPTEQFALRYIARTCD